MPSASFADFDRRATAGERLSVVFFGGSLTWGANASDPQLTSYRGRMGTWLRERYPKASFVFFDAAIGGTGSKLGIFRLERDVLSRDPDLVFLDFTINDDIRGTDARTLGSYERILRELIGRGIPVLQVLLGCAAEADPNCDLATLPRHQAHKALSQAYGTGLGDVVTYLQKAAAKDAGMIERCWPFEGCHPDDEGYGLYFEGARLGFEQAVAESRVCAIPQRVLPGDLYASRQRLRLVEQPLPKGWSQQKTFRTAQWFDGLSSRWMGDVAVADAAVAPEPLNLSFRGTLLGIFGERYQDGLPFRVTVDGQELLPPDAKPGEAWTTDTRSIGNGNLYRWLEITDALAPGEHDLVISPLAGADGKGQLRIESVCAAE